MTEPRCNERTLHCHFEEPHEHLITDTLTCTVCGQSYQWTHRCEPQHSEDQWFAAFGRFVSAAHGGPIGITTPAICGIVGQFESGDRSQSLWTAMSKAIK